MRLLRGACVLFLAFPLILSCKHPTSPSTPAPTVKSVTVSPSEGVSVYKGSSIEFTAVVAVSGGASTDVTWSVTGNTLSNTKIIDESGNKARLEVAENENAAKLTVTATSKADTKKFFSVEVAVQAQAAAGSVTSVVIAPKTTSVQKGMTQQFTVSVAVTGSAHKNVEWSVTGKNSSSTSINASGLLTVAANETAASLTVTVKSTFDTSKADTATVAVSSVPVTPAVTSVAIRTKPQSVARGGTYQFEANVETLGGASAAVAWAVTGSKSVSTGINAGGLLTVGSGETADALTVTVTSEFDDTKKDSAVITLTGSTLFEAIWVAGIPSWTDFPPGAPMKPETDGTFTAVIDAAADATFRFSLSDTTQWGDVWNGNWFAPEINNTSMSSGAAGNQMKFFAADTSEGSTSSCETAWKVTEQGYYKLTVNQAEKKFYAEKLSNTPAVISVAVTPKTASVEKGTTGQFEALVAVTGGAAQTVAWAVTGKNSSSTSINASGLLAVAADETAATLTVTATSTIDDTKSDFATVTVSSISAVWLVGNILGEWDDFPPGTPMTKEANGTFTREVNIAAEGLFRFSLTNTTGWGDVWNGSWFAPAAQNTAVTFDNSENTMIRFDTNKNEGANSATENTWKISAGYYKFIVNPATMKLRVEKPAVVEAVSIEGPGTVSKDSAGSTYTAAVTGKNSPAQSVTWSIVETTVKTGTTIGASTGILAVAADETLSKITVKATSTANTAISGTKEVNISSLDLGSVIVSIKIDDKGGGSLSITGGIPPTTPVIYKDSSAGNTSIAFAVDRPNSGYTYSWIVDDAQRVDANAITFNASDFPLGYHSVRLMVNIEGTWWSSTDQMGFTVARP